MREAENEVVVRFELPGFEANELNVHLTGNVLVVEASHREGEPGKEEETASARRSITLPEGLERERLKQPSVTGSWKLGAESAGSGQSAHRNQGLRDGKPSAVDGRKAPSDCGQTRCTGVCLFLRPKWSSFKPSPLD